MYEWYIEKFQKDIRMKYISRIRYVTDKSKLGIERAIFYDSTYVAFVKYSTQLERFYFFHVSSHIRH